MALNTIRTQPISHCPLCGQPGVIAYKDMTDRLYQVPGCWNFLKCANCDVLWLHPRPIVNDIPKCYPNEYFTHEKPQFVSLGHSAFKRRLRLLALQTRFGYPMTKPPNRLIRWLIQAIMLIPTIYRKVTMDLGPMLLPYRQNGRILDVGCGNGLYLALMKQLGWDVVGVEVDPKAAEIAQSCFGISVHIGTLEDAPFEEASFDAVTMIHVIEHMPDPISSIRLAAHFLKARGWLVIMTPNASSLGVKIFRKDWYAFNPPQHLFLFTPQSIRACIIQSGCFKQVKVSSLTRISRKIYRKFVLVRKTGQFRHTSESEISLHWRTRALSWLFENLESIGNPLMQWGEEIGCIAIKA